MSQRTIHTEQTQYTYDSSLWLYKFMYAFFYGIVQNDDYAYDLKPTKKVIFLPLSSYTYDTFSVLNTDYDYFCGDMNKLALQNDYFSVSAASSSVFWKHTATEFETGLDYFGARYYDSDLSVWLSVDPLAIKYPNQSPYSYVGNRPINTVDLWGLDEVTDPNGNKSNAGKGYVATKDGKYLHGNNLKTKVWNPNLETGQTSDGQVKGGYEDYNGDPINFDTYGKTGNAAHYSGKDLKLRNCYSGNDPISLYIWSQEQKGKYMHLSGSVNIKSINTPLPNIPDMYAMNVQVNAIVGGGGSVNFTFGSVGGEPFFAISPSIGSGFDVSVSGGFTWGDYKGSGIPLPQSLIGGFTYQNAGGGLFGGSFTQDAKSRNGVTEFGRMWTTQSVNLNAGSKTFFGGSAGAGVTFVF